ncbi:hypothetical protein, partial [Rhizobium sp. ARZ01]|uniref:hypothetical protein n=1 Tax=Rhizobium sp. ARZ01 TaxID=2769313 RepID=UPI001AEF1854
QNQLHSIRIHSETSERVRQSLAAPPPSLVRRFLGPTPNQVNSQNDSFLKNLVGRRASAGFPALSAPRFLYPHA